MIPFSRLLKYGNVVKSAELEVATSANTIYVLNTTTNNLYAASHYAYMVGAASTDTSWAGQTFQFVRSNIKKIFGNNGTTLTSFMLTTDNKILALGNQFSFTGVNSVYSPFTDVTSTLTSAGIDCSLITQMEAWYNTKISIVLSTGAVYNIGQNTLGGMGCFGSGRTTNSYSTAVFSMNNIKKVTGNLWLTTDGILYAAGDNSRYQFGNNSTVSSWVRVQVDTDVKDIACGYGSRYYIKNDGSMYCTGSAISTNYNELGLGSGTINYTAQTPKLCGSNVLSLGTNVGNLITFKLTTDGKWSATGNNANGQFGNGTSASSYVFTPAVGTFDLSSTILSTTQSTVLLENNKLYICGVKLGAGANSSSDISSTFVPITFNFT